MISIKKQTLIRSLPNQQIPLAVQSDKHLLAYCLRKDLIKIPHQQLTTIVNYLAESSRITIEQYDTLCACLKSGDYSRVLNNKQVERLIHVKN